MNILVDLSDSIARVRENAILNKPFRVRDGRSAYAVYTKDQNDNIIRVDFDACSSDKTNVGPIYTSQHWGSKVDVAKAAVSKPEDTSINQLADYYLSRVVNPSSSEDWNGYEFYSHEQLLRAKPDLKNVPSVYTLNIPTSKETKIGSDTLYNSQVKEQLDKVAAK